MLSLLPALLPGAEPALSWLAMGVQAAAPGMQALQEGVATAVGGVLGADVGPDQPLMAAGLDSLGAQNKVALDNNGSKSQLSSCMNRPKAQSIRSATGEYACWLAESHDRAWPGPAGD